MSANGPCTIEMVTSCAVVADTSTSVSQRNILDQSYTMGVHCGSSWLAALQGWNARKQQLLQKIESIPSKCFFHSYATKQLPCQLGAWFVSTSVQSRFENSML